MNNSSSYSKSKRGLGIPQGYQREDQSSIRFILLLLQQSFWIFKYYCTVFALHMMMPLAFQYSLGSYRTTLLSFPRPWVYILKDEQASPQLLSYAYSGELGTNSLIQQGSAIYYATIQPLIMNSILLYAVPKQNTYISRSSTNSWHDIQNSNIQ